MHANRIMTSYARVLFQNKTLSKQSITLSQKFHIKQDNRHTWSVLNYVYQRNLKEAKKKYACLLLNMNGNIQDSFVHFKYIWDEADLKIGVDGSANFLARNNMLHTTDVISGDFDSIDTTLIKQLQNPRKATNLKEQTVRMSAEMQMKPQIIETPNQNETDFTKAIHVVTSLRPDIQSFMVLFHSDGKRMDHLFGLINTLHLFKSDIFILNIDSGTIFWLLQPGHHVILKPHGQELCSLVPFNGSSEVKTQGLLYNLNRHHPMSFGTLISTSNFCQPGRDKIIIDNKRDILWSLDLQLVKISSKK